LTRVELDLDASDDEMKSNLDYIRNDEDITDIVISRKDDVLSALYRLKRLFKYLEDIPHVNAIRLRSHKFNYNPEYFSHTLINQLAKLNNVSIVNPKRLEIETQFLHSDEITPRHKELSGYLGQRGITVYNNTPLLPFINDSEDEMLKIAYGLRECGIEFHHLYITGLPIQQQWSEKYPVDISILIDIATRIRRNESGRGIPRLIIRTQFGEVDFNLTSENVDTDEEGRVYVKLLPYTIEYFRRMDPEFQWPDEITVGEDGHPVLLVDGLKRTPDFLFDSAVVEPNK
jgi:L-lysine 2,3-aminomutase